MQPINDGNIKEPPLAYDTLGDLAANPKFHVNAFAAILSLVHFALIVGYDEWPMFCAQHHWAFHFGVGAMMTLTILSWCTLISWILLDDCCWFLTFSAALILSVMFFTSGVVYAHGYRTCLGAGLSVRTEPSGSNAIESEKAPAQNRLIATSSPKGSTFSKVNGFLLLAYSFALLAICIYVSIAQEQ